MQAVDFLTLWRNLAPGDLPGPVAEYRFHPVRRWRFDWAWPAAARGGVAVEIDGGQWAAGGGRHNTDPDREKLNTAAALGWRVLRFSHAALVADPAGCIELAAAALILGDGAGLGGDPGGFRAASGQLPGGQDDAGGGGRLASDCGNHDAGGGDLRGVHDLAEVVATVDHSMAELRGVHSLAEVGRELRGDPGGNADAGGDPAPAAAAVKLQRGATVKLQRRPGLQLARSQPVKLARRGGDLLGPTAA